MCVIFFYLWWWHTSNERCRRVCSDEGLICVEITKNHLSAGVGLFPISSVNSHFMIWRFPAIGVSKSSIFVWEFPFYLLQLLGYEGNQENPILLFCGINLCQDSHRKQGPGSLKLAQLSTWLHHVSPPLFRTVVDHIWVNCKDLTATSLEWWLVMSKNQDDFTST